MSGQSNNEFFKTLGKLALIGGITFLGYKVSEAQINVLLEDNDEEAIDKILRLAVLSDDSSWSTFRVMLGSRVYTSSRAATLARFADNMRQQAEVLNEIIGAAPERIFNFCFEFIPNIDEGSWMTVQQMLQLRSEEHERADAVLKLMQHIRFNLSQINQLLQYEPRYAAQLLDGMLYGMAPNDRQIFVTVLRSRARSIPDIRVQALLGQVQQRLGQ